MPLVFIPWDGFRSIKNVFPAISSTMLAVLITTWLVFAFFVFWQAVKLKTVVMNDQVLHVKGYLKEIDVPFANVADISRSLVVFPHVTLRLRTSTEFGEKIMFLAKNRVTTETGSRSTFEELKERIARTQS